MNVCLAAYCLYYFINMLKYFDKESSKHTNCGQLPCSIPSAPTHYPHISCETLEFVCHREKKIIGKVISGVTSLETLYACFSVFDRDNKFACLVIPEEAICVFYVYFLFCCCCIVNWRVDCSLQCTAHCPRYHTVKRTTFTKCIYFMAFFPFKEIISYCALAFPLFIAFKTSNAWYTNCRPPFCALSRRWWLQFL